MISQLGLAVFSQQVFFKVNDLAPARLCSRTFLDLFNVFVLIRVFLNF